MSRFSSFLLGVVVGVVLYAAASNFHVVRARDGLHLLTKQPARLSETYVDIRRFSMADWANHPQLAAALAQANKQYLIGDSASAALEESVNQLAPAWPNP